MNRQWERQYLMAHPIAPKPLGWRWYAGLVAEFVVGAGDRRDRHRVDVGRPVKAASAVVRPESARCPKCGDRGGFVDASPRYIESPYSLTGEAAFRNSHQFDGGALAWECRTCGFETLTRPADALSTEEEV